MAFRDELESKLTTCGKAAGILQEEECILVKQCTQNRMYLNMHALNKTPFIDNFIYAKIRNDDIASKNIMLTIVVGNILNKIVDEFTNPTGGYQTVSSNIDKKWLLRTPNLFTLRDHDFETNDGVDDDKIIAFYIP